jgi:hypothetical protein
VTLFVVYGIGVVLCYAIVAAIGHWLYEPGDPPVWAMALLFALLWPLMVALMIGALVVGLVLRWSDWWSDS